MSRKDSSIPRSRNIRLEALVQAEGQLTQAKAQLANDEAVHGGIELDGKRYTALAREQAAPQQVSTTRFKTISPT